MQELVANDPSIKEMQVVPTYANPTGAVYTEEVHRHWYPCRLRRRTSGSSGTTPTRCTISRMWRPALRCSRHGGCGRQPDRVFLFASTSKITFAGAGVSFFASSPANVAWYLAQLSKRSIGPDKINHLRHARFSAA